MDSGGNQGGDRQRDGFFRTLTQVEKAVVFASLLILFWLIGGFDWSSTSLRFVFGAVIALWLRPEPIGTFRRVSFHGIAVFFGCVLMLWAVVMTMLFHVSAS
ncbi:MAG: hypothetical protein FD161_933 [Limisphaerales bacterium]|nr:MAG: hypothetical protein FD161_933 [Limisphaerales bacterium]KAG0509915.1 MAG: hypothetical protein E1N63_933 [Limisphaerales bacterium]TXT50614.1 MAG: hypothetical protein FD140_2246 [Limisphaerales bacterium]